MGKDFDFRDMLGGASGNVTPDPALADTDAAIDNEAARAHQLSESFVMHICINSTVNRVNVAAVFGLMASQMAHAYQVEQGDDAREYFLALLERAIVEIRAGRM